MKLIECPVCLEHMRPATRAIAICTNGHLFCHPCGKRVNSSDNDTCPMCRIDAVSLTPNHNLAVNLIDIVSSWIDYQCSHERCDFIVTGRKIIEHEKLCEWKPLTCPKQSCPDKVPYKSFLSNRHSCMQLVEGVDKESVRAWKHLVYFQDLYDFDTHREHISVAFKPALLVPPENEPHDKLCVTALTVTVGGGIIFLLGSLETTEDLSPEIKVKNFTMSVDIHTKLGKIGYTCKVSPLTQGETVNSERHGVFMWRSTLINYLKSVSLHGCHKCPNNTVPHLHLTVKECRA